jgi:hypothetical protein
LLVVAMAIALLIVLAGGGAVPERRLAIDVASDQPGGLQVYFDVGGGLSEGASAKLRYAAGSNRIFVPLPDARLRALRIDPDPTSAALRIAGVAIDIPQKDVLQALPLASLGAANQIASIERVGGAVIVHVQSGANDPQLLLPVDDAANAPSRIFNGVMKSAQLLLLFSVCGFVVLRLSRFKGGLPVPAMLIAAWVFVAAMAMTSSTSQPVHPDEIHHVAAANYYLSNWRPPEVDDPRIRDSYSGYGTSYLDELDVVYVIAAKASTIWAGLHLDPMTSLRLFNVLLFGILVLLAFQKRQAWPGVVVLLMTPQLWYVFSYFNADALPFFLSVLAALLLAAKDSAISRYIEGGRVSPVAILLFAVAVGLLLVSKRNYLPVVFFIGLLITQRHLGLGSRGMAVGVAGAALLVVKLVAGAQLDFMFPSAANLFLPVGLLLLAWFAGLCLWPSIRRVELRPKLYRVILIFAAALIVATPRIAMDWVVNGSPAEKSAKMQAAAERNAELALRPSTLEKNLGASLPGLHLAAKGVQVAQIVGAPYNWLEISWRSLLGVYGYMTVFAPDPLYWMLGAGWLFIVLGATSSGHRVENRKYLFATVAGMALVALSSIVHSWANDFQAQGRYLLPGLAMLAAYLLSSPGLLRGRWVSIGMATCFVGAVLSFGFVALPALAGR